MGEGESWSRPSTERARTILAGHVHHEDQGDVARGIHIAVPRPWAALMAVTVVGTVHGGVNLLVTFHARKAARAGHGGPELVDEDDAAVPRQVVAHLGDGRRRHALHRRWEHAVAKHGHLAAVTDRLKPSRLAVAGKSRTRLNGAARLKIAQDVTSGKITRKQAMNEHDLGASTVDAYVKQLADKGVESFHAEDPRKTVQKVENDVIEGMLQRFCRLARSHKYA